MPLPVIVEQLEQELIGIYQAAQARIDAELLAIANNPAKFRQRSRLEGTRQRISEAMDQVRQQAEFAVPDVVDRIYLTGGEHSQYRIAQVASDQGGTFRPSPGGFGQIDRSAVSALAAGLGRDLLEATQNVESSTKTLIREFVREGVATQLIQGKSSLEASRIAQGFLERNGVYAVKYSNGARHGVAEYARMAVRTTSALAYNEGIFQSASGEGVEFYEVFDGPGCGWTAHDDPGKANGSIRTVSACRQFPIAHPNCRRSFGPRPDVVANDQGDAEVAADRMGLPRVPLSVAKPFGFQDAALQKGQNILEAQKRPAIKRRQAALRRRQERIGSLRADE